MKKLLASLLVLTMPFTTFAGSVDVHSVIVQNNDTTDAFTLNTETTRTEYRTEVVEDICYRQEIERYERVCDNRPFFNGDVRSLIASTNDNPPRQPRPPREPGPSRPDPRPDPRPNPRPEPRPPSRPDPRPNPRPEPRPPSRPDPRPNPRPEPRPPSRPDPRPHPRPEPRPPVCYDRPVYRTVAYSCMKTVQVPYEVRVSHATTAFVKVSAAPASRPQTGNCGIDFKLAGQSFSANNSCSEYIATANITQTQNGDTPNYNYDITLHDGVSILAPLAGGLKNLTLESGSFIVAKVGTLTNSENFKLQLYVERNKTFGKDVVLINRELKSTEFSYQAIDEQTGYVRINADKVFGGIQNNKKHNIRLSLTVKLPNGVVISGGAWNGQKLEQSAEIKVD